MKLDSDFRYFVISIDKATESLRHKPLEYENGGVDESAWVNLYPPEQPFHKELKRYNVQYKGEQLSSYIRLSGTDIWMITEIDYQIVKSFMCGPFKSFSRETLKPFHFCSHKSEFTNYESIYNGSRNYDWVDSRPTLVYIEPKEDKKIEDSDFLILGEELKTTFKASWEDRFLDFYTAAPVSSGHFVAGVRVFLYRKKGKLEDKRVSNHVNSENEDIFLPSELRGWINHVNDLQQLYNWKEWWGHFRFPEIHRLETQNLHISNIEYADELANELLAASQEYHKAAYGTKQLLSDSQDNFEKFTALLMESADPGYNSSNAATLRFMVFEEFEKAASLLRKANRDDVGVQLERMNNYISNFYSVASTKENIKLQKKVYYLSILVFVLAILTIFFAGLNEDTVVMKLLRYLGIVK